MKINRRDTIRILGATTSGLVALPAWAGSGNSTVTTDIAGRRELFIDDALVDRLSGSAHREMHHPVPREIAVVHDQPWEGSGSGYHSVFHDGNLYRMYYKAWHLAPSQGKLDTGRHPLYCCYAESDDGIRWRKPELGLHDFEGSTANNIVMISGPRKTKDGAILHLDPGHPAVFLDDNPNAQENARYKAIIRSSNPNGLIAMKSADGIHWSPLSDKPILVGLGAFDSQNLAFWDPRIGKYRAYWRIFTAGETTVKKWKPAGIRAIRTATSNDLIHWEPHTDITYEDSPDEQLYTNQIKPYYRAPHLLIGFPARYVDRGWSESMRQLPEHQHRQLRSSSSPRYGTALTDTLLMASRDGHKFYRWNESFLRPGIQRPGSWNYGMQYVAWHVVETESFLAGAPNELSLYASENYWTGDSSEVRRYSLRLDGFVSVNASAQGGEVITTPIQFDGRKLSLNFSTSVAGSVRVEMQNGDGVPVSGYSLADCPPIFGDTTDRTVHWKSGNDLSSLAGQAVRVRFELRDADLYSYQFVS